MLTIILAIVLHANNPQVLPKACYNHDYAVEEECYEKYVHRTPAKHILTKRRKRYIIH
jgi:hypothetical protein